jgi:hypothetical protein
MSGPLGHVSHSAADRINGRPTIELVCKDIAEVRTCVLGVVHALGMLKTVGSDGVEMRDHAGPFGDLVLECKVRVEVVAADAAVPRRCTALSADSGRVWTHTWLNPLLYDCRTTQVGRDGDSHPALRVRH